MARVQTHSEECWRWHGHSECAVRKVEQLRAALEKIANANAKAYLSAADCEYIARKALGWDTSRIYPTD